MAASTPDTPKHPKGPISRKLMHTTRSLTTVAEPDTPVSLLDSTQFHSPEPTSSSSGVRRRLTPPQGVQLTTRSLRQRAAVLMQPEKKVGPAPTVWKSVRAIILASYFNVLLICIPISWALNFASPHQYTLIFVFSFLAIIPLSKLLAFATDDLSIRVGQTLGGLMKATLGNAVGLIVSIIALVKCELDTVQSALVGTILCNLLFVLGMCFFVGGLKFSEQGFARIAAQMNSALLTISVVTVLLPGAFVLFLDRSNLRAIDSWILGLSRGVAIIMLFGTSLLARYGYMTNAIVPHFYVSYLFFQLFSHKASYQDHSEEIIESKKYTENPFKTRRFSRGKQATAPQYATTPLVAPQQRVRFSTVDDRQTCNHQPTSDPESDHVTPPMLHEEEIEEPRMHIFVSFGLMIAVVVLVTVTASFMVDANVGLTSVGNLSKKFVGIILFPVVGNTAEHITAVAVAIKDKLTLSLSVAVGSSIQMALFVIPSVITLGWILDKPLTLLFDPFESIVLFLSAHAVNYILWRGKSNWLEGIILMCFYLILCVMFWYYHGVDAPFTC